MATAVTLSKNGNGKRERNQMEAEDSEFVPLSKRINNLHLHPNGGGGASIQHNSHPHFLELPQQGLNGDSHLYNNGGIPIPVHLSSSSSSHDPSSHHLHNIHSSDIIARHSGGSSGETYHPAVSGNYDRHNAMNGLNHHELLSKPEQQSCVHVTNGPPHDLRSMNHSYDYSPSLDSSANPHYYEPNRQLYLLYLERMERTGQILHPQFFQSG